jgi:hypothetical protein
VLQPPRSGADGMTHIVFEPSEFLEELVTLTPRPRINLIIYSGVFAGHARIPDRAGLHRVTPAIYSRVFRLSRTASSCPRQGCVRLRRNPLSLAR